MKVEWIAYLSNGKIYTDKQLLVLDNKRSPWLTLVDIINAKNLSRDKDDKKVEITNLQIIIDGKIHNSLSKNKNGFFNSKCEVSHFWIFGRSDFEFFTHKEYEWISMSFLVNNEYRIFIWFDKSSGESWIEVADYNDPRNLKVMEAFK